MGPRGSQDLRSASPIMAPVINDCCAFTHIELIQSETLSPPKILVTEFDYS